MVNVKRSIFISIPIAVFILLLVSFILTSNERATDVIYGATIYDLPEKTQEEKAVESTNLECKRFCDVTKSLNDTQKEFMLGPLTSAYCMLGFNETIYKKDINSDGVFKFVSCPEIYDCLIKFENVGLIKLNCTK